MSETPPPIEDQKKSKKLTAPRLLVITVVLALIIIAVMNWAYGVREAGARRAAHQQGVIALATALRPSMLRQDNAVMERLIVDVAKYAGYDSIEVSNENGRVLASTNRQTSGQVIEAMAKADEKAAYSGQNGKWAFVTGIYLAEGNKLGAVRVVITP